jgi:hypothetical protein
VEAFAVILRAAGLDTTVRRNRGLDIGAACGQLAAEHAGQPPPDAVQRRRDMIERRSAAALANGAPGNGAPGNGAPGNGGRAPSGDRARARTTRIESGNVGERA